MIIKETVSTKDTLKALEATSALTWEELHADDKSLSDVADWLASTKALFRDEVEFFITPGHLMNEYYGLHVDNAYPDDLTIVSVDVGCYGPMKIAIPRFAVGGRWFDDIAYKTVATRMTERDFGLPKTA